VDVAGCRTRPPPVRLWQRPVRRRPASRHRRRRVARYTRPGAGRGRRFVRGHRSGRRTDDHHPHPRRIRGDVAAARLDRRLRGPSRLGGRCRRDIGTELGCRHHVAARSPRHPHRRRSGRVSRSSHAPSGGLGSQPRGSGAGSAFTAGRAARAASTRSGRVRRSAATRGGPRACRCSRRPSGAGRRRGRCDLAAANLAGADVPGPNTPVVRRGCRRSADAGDLAACRRRATGGRRRSQHAGGARGEAACRGSTFVAERARASHRAPGGAEGPSARAPSCRHSSAPPARSCAASTRRPAASPARVDRRPHGAGGARGRPQATAYHGTR
jgi:hypothetical protein